MLKKMNIKLYISHLLTLSTIRRYRGKASAGCFGPINEFSEFSYAEIALGKNLNNFLSTNIYSSYVWRIIKQACINKISE